MNLKDIIMDNYKIFIVNKTSSKKQFWAFLSEPEDTFSSDLYLNSSAYITIKPNNTKQLNSFTIPLQYSTEAGCSNNAVGLNTVIESSITEKVDLTDGLTAAFTISDEHLGPDLSSPVSGTADPGKVEVEVDPFAQNDEEKYSWYPSLTFGVQSQQGFMGYSWSPEPGETYKIKPKVKFYIATGSWESNQLLDMSSISTDSAEVTENDFDTKLECTVTLENGEWTVTKGRPLTVNDQLIQMIESHNYLSKSHAQLISLIAEASLITDLTVEDKEKSRSDGVEYPFKPKKQDKALSQDVASPFIYGRIALSSAIGFGFTYMFASGTKFKLVKRNSGTDFIIGYDGDKAAEQVRELLKVGAALIFTKD
ncbi:hypothetical protein D104_02220 [Marinomonas profundimaris]|uniref:Uncharacterized protein n=2 Tax=Marinomonas profundimaris TaxID=1208321 RepID=W1RYI2_9GAMM|nr:hypothetical protein D104_02220 [Marinomonas profundimaris]